MTDDPNKGRIMEHERELGTPSVDTVEQRAREIAEINGRAAEVNDDDRHQARRELQGLHVQTEREAGVETFERGATRNPGDPVPKAGSQAPTRQEQDEATMPEQLAKEGVREAEHDLQRQGQRRPKR